MSFLLTLSNIAYTYEDSPELALGPLSAAFPQGWTGIVGNNGAGKSTLLKIATGELTEYSGSITPDPAGGAFHGVYCAQATEHLPSLAQDFVLDYDSDAALLRQTLGVEEEWAWRFDTLSHGERKRLQIAVALWQNPPLLALDEPTNHVDATTRKTLLSALKEYRGVGLLVSHDRFLLDSLVGQCLFFEDGGATMRPGTYSDARAQRDLERKTKLGERKNAKAELGRLHAEQARRKEIASRADAKKSKRNIDPKDHAAKAMIDLAIFTGQDGKAGRLSSQMNARMVSAEKRVEESRVSKVYESDIWLDAHPSKRKTLYKLEAGSIPLGPPEEKRVLSFPDLYIGNSDHIGLSGDNGSGKSTLINYLISHLPEDVPVLYLPQEVTTEQARDTLTRLKSLMHEEQGRALSIVAQLNSPPKRILAGEDLSPGELRKVMLALGIMSEPQLIVMDEPTNHLDLHSIEALERVLRECPCALLLVSHDAPFLSAVTDIGWEFVQDLGRSTEIHMISR